MFSKKKKKIFWSLINNFQVQVTNMHLLSIT